MRRERSRSTPGSSNPQTILEASLHRTGVLPSQAIRAYVEDGIVAAPEAIQEAQIQPASIDLRLGAIAYELRASFLPGGYSSIERKLDDLQLRIGELDLTNGATLRPGHVYLVELMEQVKLPPEVWGKANPRSTTGRADLFTRLLCDFSTEFEGVPAGYKGKLFAEIVPRTFAVKVRRGTRVNQLRFSRGSPPPSDKSIADISRAEPVVYVRDEGPSGGNVRRGLHLSVDLTPEDSAGIIGYRAKRNAPVFDFDCVACYEPLDFWEPILHTGLQSIVLQPDDFYILRSRERVRIPPTFAAELMPYEATFGEFRVHYAGFLDPGFGYGSGDVDGTPVVLEVRARDVPFLVEDGQTIARILYYRLRDTPDKIYGATIGSSYQAQKIALGKQFKSR